MTTPTLPPLLKSALQLRAEKDLSRLFLPAMTTPTPRQLPGVKGQWILCSDCPPVDTDVDIDGEVQVIDNVHNYGFICKPPHEVDAHEYWSPNPLNDPRPFTLPAETTPQQTEVVARKYDKLTSHTNGISILAVADDGTAWYAKDAWGDTTDWRQLPSLPDREVG
jgi:hypothetical protein